MHILQSQGENADLDSNALITQALQRGHAHAFKRLGLASQTGCRPNYVYGIWILPFSAETEE